MLPDPFPFCRMGRIGHRLRAGVRVVGSAPALLHSMVLVSCPATGYTREHAQQLEQVVAQALQSK